MDKTASLPLPGEPREPARPLEELTPPAAMPHRPHRILAQQASAWGNRVPGAPRHSPA